ncbi:MAG: BBE domain-containing protein, partial [Gemmatimonadota bacterium]|nr:BBE domain-containing protein [Gemmatimonadota bacterium]
DPLTGAVSDRRAGATAFPWRHHLAELQWSVRFPSDPSLEAVKAARRWVNGAHQAIASESVGAYVNRLEPGRSTADYYGANLARLRRIKAAVDPSDFFRSAYTV